MKNMRSIRKTVIRVLVVLLLFTAQAEENSSFALWNGLDWNSSVEEAANRIGKAVKHGVDTQTDFGTLSTLAAENVESDGGVPADLVCLFYKGMPFEYILYYREENLTSFQTVIDAVSTRYESMQDYICETFDENMGLLDDLFSDTHTMVRWTIGTSTSITAREMGIDSGLWDDAPEKNGNESEYKYILSIANEPLYQTVSDLMVQMVEQ